MRPITNRMHALLVSGICAIAAPALALEPPALETGFLPARIAGFVYINAMTGERVMTQTQVQLPIDVFWESWDTAGSCNFFYTQDNPARDTAATGRVKFGSAVVHWGDTSPDGYVGGYDFAYATDIPAGPSGTVSGLSIVNAFIDDYDGVVTPGGAASVVIAAFEISDLQGAGQAGSPPPFPGWVYTIDLEGTEFQWSKWSSVCPADLDQDGLHDFGYSYEFAQRQTGPKGVIGPLLVRPFSLGGQGAAYGCPDRFDWFNQTDGPGTFSGYTGGLWFGGGDCSVPRPYASFFLNMYGSQGGGSPCPAIVDFVRDCHVDFLDYLEFLNLYDAGSPTADFTHDGVVDFSDYLEFLNLFVACGG